MNVTATDFTIAAVLQPEEARALLDVIDLSRSEARHLPAVEEFRSALRRFVDGEDECAS